MSRFGFYLAFLLLLRPVRGDEPASFQTYQKRASVALQVESGQLGKDCPNSKNTLESNSCLIDVAEKTQNNFHEFYESLRGLLKPDSDAARQLDSSQTEWEKYSASACKAIDSFYRSGSIRISAVKSCQIQLTRSRMQDLDSLYNTTLHH